MKRNCRAMTLGWVVLIFLATCASSNAIPLKGAFGGSLTHSTVQIEGMGHFDGTNEVTVTGTAGDTIQVNFTYAMIDPSNNYESIGSFQGVYKGKLVAGSASYLSDFTGPLTITGGTGPFAGATGSGQVSGTLLRRSHGSISGTFTGNIYLPTVYQQAFTGNFAQPAGSFTTGQAANFGMFTGETDLGDSTSTARLGSFTWVANDGEQVNGPLWLDLTATTTPHLWNFTGTMLVKGGAGQYDGAIGFLAVTGTITDAGAIKATYSGNLFLRNSTYWSGTVLDGNSTVLQGRPGSYKLHNGVNTGTLSGGIGAYSGTMRQDFDLNSQTLQGSAVWSIGGDQLNLDLIGPLDPTNPKKIVEGIDVIFRGGTGRFKKAGGSGEITLKLDPTTGKYSGVFSGWIILPPM